MTAATCRHGSHPGGACRECARAADRLNQPIGYDQPKDRTMTAAEAREAAAWHRDEAGDPPSDETYAMHRRAALALDAFADGLDAAAAPEFRPTSSDTNRLHRIRARLLDLVPLDGTMSLADDVQRLDRALADARQHALLAALWVLERERELELKVPAALSPATAEAFAHQIIDTVGAAIRDDLLALAKEATRDE